MRTHRLLTPGAVPARGTVAGLVVLAAAALTWHLLGPHFAHASGDHGPAVAAQADTHHGEHEQRQGNSDHCGDAEPCPGDGHAGTCGYLLQQDSGHHIAPAADVAWHACGRPTRSLFTNDTGSQRSRAPPDPVRELQVIRV